MLWPLTSLCVFCTCELTGILCTKLISCVDHRVDFSRSRMLTDPKDAVSPGPETGPLRKVVMPTAIPPGEQEGAGVQP